MNSRFSARRPSSHFGWIAVSLLAVVGPKVAHAQPDMTPRPAAAAPPTAALPASPIQPTPGASPWTTPRFDSAMSLEWHGGMEVDVGYAAYAHDLESLRPETFHDFRGRFVLGPVFRHDFGSGYFFRAGGQVVAWIREQASIYQVNVDDVYAQVGQKGVWDFALGRFMTWRVYRKGLGFDLYTLEDTGATKSAYAQNDFYPHTYEVDDIFYRETAGRAAFHVYPTSWSGIEVAGQYGRLDQTNQLGGRAAAGVAFDHLSVAAAGEYQQLRPALQSGSNDPMTGMFIVCDECGTTKKKGAGGGAVVTFKPVEIGFNAATQRIDIVQATGLFDQSASGKRMSFGGYAEFDLGSVIMDRRLVLGAGLNRTELLADSSDFRRHVQGAAYIAYPLGFNNVMVKLVLSRADGFWRNSQGVEQRDHVTSGRIRVKFDF
jgi:hypothetical protein